MEKNNLKTTIVARIEAVKAAEKVTKVELSALSRELLLYVPDTDDIDMVNRLVGVLTPMNRSTAILFFKHFLPFEQEEDKQGNHSRFGKKLAKAKAVARKEEAIAKFLADEANDIWSWAAANVTLEYNQKDWASLIVKDIQKALKGEKKDNGETPPLSMDEVIQAVLKAGVDVETMLLMAAEEQEKREAVAAVMAEAA